MQPLIACPLPVAWATGEAKGRPISGPDPNPAWLDTGVSARSDYYCVRGPTVRDRVLGGRSRRRPGPELSLRLSAQPDASSANPKNEERKGNKCPRRRAHSRATHWPVQTVRERCQLRQLFSSASAGSSTPFEKERPISQRRRSTEAASLHRVDLSVGRCRRSERDDRCSLRKREATPRNIAPRKWQPHTLPPLRPWLSMLGRSDCVA